MLVTGLHDYSSFSTQGYFGRPKQQKSYHNNNELLPQQSFFYASPSYYQESFIPTSGYLPSNYDHHRQSGVNSTAVIHSHRFHYRNQPQYKWSHIDEIQKHYWKHQDSALPLSTYSSSFPRHYNNYQYGREIQYSSYRVFTNSNMASFGNNKNLGYGSTSRYPAWNNTTYPNYYNVIRLTPKIRVIFILPSSPCSQQSCATPLAMPPFLFNRMTQPLCSLPLPPPLPQISSLPLTPALQQMIMQQYANPVAVLPFTANWPASPPFMSSYPPVIPQQPMLSMPAMQLSQCVPQSYPLPVLLPPMMSILPSNAPPSVPFSYPPSSIPPYAASSYPSTCRACVPAPPPLSVAVRDHRWMQHCPACQHIPADASHPNARPNNGRITPLLRHPTVIQNVQDGGAKKQQYQYPHINTATDMARWSHKMPALPPGAVIISDEYIGMNNSHRDRLNSNNKYRRQNERIVTIVKQLKPWTISNNGDRKKAFKSQSENKRKQTFSSDTDSYQSPMKSISTKSSCSSCSLMTDCSCMLSTYSSDRSSTGDSVKFQKASINLHGNKQNIDHKQLPAQPYNLSLHVMSKYRSRRSVSTAARHSRSHVDNLTSSPANNKQTDLPLSSRSSATKVKEQKSGQIFQVLSSQSSDSNQFHINYLEDDCLRSYSPSVPSTSSYSPSRNMK